MKGLLNMNISLLVMDLDGTFVYGEDQRAIISFCHQHQIRYGFITSRSYNDCLFPVNILKHYTPAFLAAAAGTELYLPAVKGRYYYDQLHAASLAAGWPDHAVILNRLECVPGCELMGSVDHFRVSCYVSDTECIQQVNDCLRGYQVCIKVDNGCQLEILPVNGNKENCIQYLLACFGCSPDSVIICGDRLDDLSVFQYSLYGIVVANCYIEFRHQLESNQAVFFTPSPGSRGVLEGLKHYIPV